MASTTAVRELKDLFAQHWGRHFPHSHPDEEVAGVLDQLEEYDSCITGLVSRVLAGESALRPVADAALEFDKIRAPDKELRVRIELLIDRKPEAVALLTTCLERIAQLDRMVELAKEVPKIDGGSSPRPDLSSGLGPAKLLPHDPETIFQDLSLQRFPSFGQTGPMVGTLGDTFRVLLGMAISEGFDVASFRLPRPATSPQGRERVPSHGTVVGERKRMQTASGFLGLRKCYTSEVMVAYVDLEPRTAVADARPNRPVGHSVSIGMGRAQSRIIKGRHASYRAIFEIEPLPLPGDLLTLMLRSLRATTESGASPR